MILSGELSDFSLADVLQLLLQQHKSGVLTLTKQKEKAEIFLSNGNLTGVRVNGETPESKVREMLVASGKVSRQEMQDMEAVARNMNRGLLATLATKGFLDENDGKEWLQIISEDLACELFGWASGRYEFGTGIKGQMPASVQMSLSTEFACMEGMRRIDEWPRLREELPDANAVFRPTGKEHTGDKQGWDFMVLSLVDGKKSLAQISKQVPFGSFRLSECIVNLWHDGIVAPDASERREAETAVAPDPQSEKDQKTALVLGVAVVILLMATAVRLFSFWMLESAGNGTGGETVDYDVAIAHSLARGNMEVFLIDYAARKDKLPADANELIREGDLLPREIGGVGHDRPVYKKIDDKQYELR